MINEYLKLFKKKRVLITGHTGFKGSWLTLCLKKFDANILGLSKDFVTNPSHYKVCNNFRGIRSKKFNICELKKLKKIIKDFKPNFIFHLAAQSLVRKSYKNPVETWMSNVLGTINILDCLKNYKEEICVIIITSDKVYKNVEKKTGYIETDILGGHDPYSASKAAAELAIKSYINTYLKNNKKILLAVARAGNVIGGGDWSKDRIIPDCIRAWSKNKKVLIRNPESTRPWQHVLESIFGYITLALKLKLKKIKNGEVYNFGPNSNKNYKVIDCLNEIKKNWTNVSWKIKKEKKILYEADLLNLNSTKAFQDLNWRNILSFSEVIKLTADWYKSYYNKKTKIISNQQIEEYLKLLNQRKKKK